MKPVNNVFKILLLLPAVVHGSEDRAAWYFVSALCINMATGVEELSEMVNMWFCIYEERRGDNPRVTLCACREACINQHDTHHLQLSLSVSFPISHHGLIPSLSPRTRE